jgi:L-serine dehydratase
VTYTGLFDMFTIGIGPSSSHTVGPMVAARRFVAGIDRVERVAGVEVTLYGSLALTGAGHATPRAVLLGMAGYEPETVPMEVVASIEADVAEEGTLLLGGRHRVAFPVGSLHLDHDFHPAHPNVACFRALDHRGAVIADREFASIGGGFVIEVDAVESPPAEAGTGPHVFRSGAELLDLCRMTGRNIASLALENEKAQRAEEEVRSRAAHIAQVMFGVIDRGLAAEGELPGGLRVQRRAAELAQQLRAPGSLPLPPTGPADWAGVWATAVGEENAAGHRIVTAPTNGAAGIVPAVLRFLDEHCTSACDDDPRLTYLLTATVIGSLLKENAGISGAELGCQGEVGAASAMAAAGLAAALGGSPFQVENAAEIALEHNLGLTCDPLRGLVQVPCIERNAIGAVKSIAAASMALRGTGRHVVSLDAAIATLRQTGRDMDRIYKETSLGGLAVNVPEC